MGLFQRADNWAGRISNWGGAFAVLIALFTWLSSQLAVLQPYGWPEAILAGFFLACVTVLVFSAALVAWRYFRPLGASKPGGDGKTVVARGQRQSLVTQEMFRERMGALEERLQKFDGKVSTPELSSRIQNLDTKFTSAITNIAATSVKPETIDILVGDAKDADKRMNHHNLDIHNLKGDVSRLIKASMAEIEALLLFSAVPPMPAFCVDVALLSANDSAKERNAAATYIAAIRSLLSDTKYIHSLDRALTASQPNAEVAVEAMPSDRHPTEINLLELRRYMIDRVKCLAALSYLENQRKEIIKELQARLIQLGQSPNLNN